MKNIIKIIWVCVLLFSCGKDNSFDPNSPNPDQTLEDLFFGTDSTFDILTWNIQEFPKNGYTTISYIMQIINALDMDVVALQEIISETDFDYLRNSLTGWNGFQATSAGFEINLAYLYNENSVQVNDIFEIFIYDERPFPRAPLVMELNWNSVPLVVINNHLKAGGNNIIEIDEWDEEHRRLDACILLEEYISENYPAENVILLGDLNDRLTDSMENNVFAVFLDDFENYFFTDTEIAGGDDSNWSFDDGDNHLDHILITNELFDEFENSVSEVQTILIDEFLQFGWQEYDDNISDHLPVGLKLAFD